ncbi:unnamed protein product [Discosporangium mesarthrocarpum]
MQARTRDGNKLVLAGLVSISVISLIALGRLVAVTALLARAGGLRRLFREPLAFGKYSYVGASSSNVGGEGSGAIQNASRILPQAFLFHVLVFLCLVIEIPVYAFHYCTDVEGGSNGLGRTLYALHLLSYLLIFGAFCVIVTLWSDVAVFEPNAWTALVNKTMLVLCFFYMVVTGLAVGVCLGLGRSGGDMMSFFSNVAFLSFCAYSIGALLILGACFLVLGCLLQRRICRVLLMGSCSRHITARVVRLNVVMLACFICFTLKAYMLVSLVQVENEDDMDENGWEMWQHEMRLEWAPHVIPCVAMLIYMRKAGQPEGAGDGRGEQEGSPEDPLQGSSKDYGGWDHNYGARTGELVPHKAGATKGHLGVL